jgi:putative ATP-binding cassette transporter
MKKLWEYLISLVLLRPLAKAGSLLNRAMDILFWMLGKAMPLLRPIGRLFLFFARLARLNKILNWEDLLIVVKPYWTGESRNKAVALLCGTLFCMVANAVSSLYFGMQVKLIFDIVGAPHTTDIEFYKAVAVLAGIGVVWALFGNGYGTFRTYLAIDWRFWMSRMYMGQYVKNEALIRIKTDNPDQRLAQDPDIFANTAVGLSAVLVETVVNLFTFVPVLLENSLVLAGCCVVCALASYVAVLWLGKSLPSLTYQQYDSEATLRTTLQDGSRYGSSIALERAEPLFLSQAETRLGTVRHVLTRIMTVNLYVGIYNFYAGQVVGNAALVAIGWLVMHGRATIGAIGQAGQAFANVYNGLTVFTSQFGAYSTIKAEIERLGPFARALDEIGENRMPQGQWIEYAEVDGKPISFDNVTILSSYLDSKPVVKDMSVVFDVDTLITGRDGHGKTDMAKAIGLGAAQGGGKITRMSRNRIMFLTQTPYIPTCTLREFLVDSPATGGVDDQRLATVLDLVGLHDLIEQSKGENTGGLDTPQNWQNRIPSPQQQQLCLARAILLKAEVIVIDQATDGLEPEIEEDIYKILRGLGVRLIAFSNSDRLAKSFKRVLELREDRGFDVHDEAKDYKVGWKAYLPSRLTGRGGTKPR